MRDTWHISHDTSNNWTHVGESSARSHSRLGAPNSLFGDDDIAVYLHFN